MSVQPTQTERVYPADDGSFRIKTDPIYPRQYVSYAIFSDEDLQTPVNPTAGTVTIKARATGMTAFIAPPNNVRQASQQSFIRLDGPTEEVEIDLSGITGNNAAFVRVTMIGYKY